MVPGKILVDRYADRATRLKLVWETDREVGSIGSKKAPRRAPGGFSFISRGGQPMGRTLTARTPFS